MRAAGRYLPARMRAINFSAGPAGLPLPALEKARDELLDYAGTGMSIMEQSHRDKPYEAVHRDATERLTKLIGIPDTHAVLWLTGGASAQFALVPMNFLPAGKSADYVMTGVWSEKALDEAKLLGTPRIAANTRNPDGKYTRVPTQAEVQFDPNAAFVHSTSNNTIYGTQFHTMLDTGKVPHICDMSSDFMWRPLDVSKFDFIYAGAQKNLGPSGVLVAIARKEFLQSARKDIPKIFRYQTHAEADSLYNTPPTLAIYLVDGRAGRTPRDGEAEPREGRAALRRARPPEWVLRGPGGEGFEVGDEHRLPHSVRGARCHLRGRVEEGEHDWSERPQDRGWYSRVCLQCRLGSGHRGAGVLHGAVREVPRLITRSSTT